MDVGSLDKLLTARSVAIIGASNDPDRLPGLSLRYLQRGRFTGAVWPVNPNRAAVQDIPAYPTLADVPGVPDLAIIATPAALVPQAIIECAEHGVGAAVIFAETIGTNDDRPDVALTALATARQAGMRVLGPNCVGAFDAARGLYPTISLSLSDGLPTPGNVAVVSQSGAYGEQLRYLLSHRGLGVRYLVTTGNEVDLSASDAIAWMAAQPDISVIAAYAEGVRDAAAFTGALKLAREAGKRVIFMKVGTSAAGSAAAASHTAALAGDDKFWDLALAKHGAYRAASTRELVEIAYAAAQPALPDSRRLGILTVSGGFGIQLADAASANNLDPAPLPDALAAHLRQLLPFGSIANPLDASGQVVAHLDRLEDTIVVMARDGDYGALVVALGSVPLVPSMQRPVVEALLAAKRRLHSQLVAICALTPPAVTRELENAGFLLFEDEHAAVQAISALATLADHRYVPARVTTSRTAALLEPGLISEHEAKRILSASGVPTWPEALAKTSDDAATAAHELGLPVAMKVCSRHITHKTDIGGVVLGVSDLDQVRRTFDELCARAARAGFSDDQLDGVIVSPMAPTGIETILGVHVDRDFGPAVVFGSGGVHAEIFDDAALRLAPIDEHEAQAMIRQTRIHALLCGARGAPQADLDALASALVALSVFAADNAEHLTAVDINPFVVWADGAAALDALIIAGRQDTAPGVSPAFSHVRRADPRPS